MVSNEYEDRFRFLVQDVNNLENDYYKLCRIDQKEYYIVVGVDSNKFMERTRLSKQLHRIQICLQSTLDRMKESISTSEGMTPELDQFMLCVQTLRAKILSLLTSIATFCTKQQFVVVCRWDNPNHNDQSFLYARFVSGVCRRYNPNFELYGDNYVTEDSIKVHFEKIARK